MLLGGALAEAVGQLQNYMYDVGTGGTTWKHPRSDWQVPTRASWSATTEEIQHSGREVWSISNQRGSFIGTLVYSYSTFQTESCPGIHCVHMGYINSKSDWQEAEVSPSSKSTKSLPCDTDQLCNSSGHMIVYIGRWFHSLVPFLTLL